MADVFQDIIELEEDNVVISGHAIIKSEIIEALKITGVTDEQIAKAIKMIDRS